MTAPTAASPHRLESALLSGRERQGRGAVTAAIDVGEHPVEAAIWLARAFVAGARLAVWAPDAPDHAHHVVVEFVHPVVAGTRALPAVIASPGTQASPDAALVIGNPTAARGADLFISAEQPDPMVVLSYHLLWELVQVALEHPGIVEGPDAGGDSTGFLYPFLDGAGHDEAELSAALSESARAKRVESERLAEQSLELNLLGVAQVGDAVNQALRDGGTVLTMGNGGSATDAARLARLLRAGGARAESLPGDYAVITALANDLGAERIFSRQLDSLGRRGDVLVGCSTSGASPNLHAAFDRAAEVGMTTVGLSGYGGEVFAGRSSVQHSLVVQSMSVHRIQEAQAALMSALCERALAGQAMGSRQ